MQAVILAAGEGARLRPLTDGAPKSLLTLHGRPILNHVLDALSAAGVDDAIIVAGYRSASVREALTAAAPCGMRLRFIENAAFRLGNARSLWEARDIAHEGFLLAMGDHLIDPAIPRALLAGERGRCRLAVDRNGIDGADDVTRALVEEGRVLELGKQLERWNAIDTGVFWCTARIFEQMPPALRDGELSAVFAGLARAGELDAVDVTGMRWIDIDTPDDLRRAEGMIGADGRLA